jgi:predicted CXXCH cytochrome family protein
VGPQACAECHPGESALFARSGHRRTLWPAASSRNAILAWLDGATVADPEVPEVTWSYHLRAGTLQADRTVDGRTETIALDYGFGSGSLGITFVALQSGSEPGIDPLGIEHRLSYFASRRRLGITPGQERPKEQEDSAKAQQPPVTWGKSMGKDLVQQCFGCHSTLTSTQSRNRLEPATMMPNVTCERCHGPGLAHIEAARRGETELSMRMGTDRVEPTVEVNLCGGCHRLPRVIAPGQIRPENVGIVRFQSVGLSVSSCYADGLSGLRCVSCHDPHDRVSTNLLAYEAVCLSCHQAGATHRPCPVSPAAKCIGCHMPRRASGNGLFTDHWIRKPDVAARPESDHRPTAAARATPPASLTRGAG